MCINSCHLLILFSFRGDLETKTCPAAGQSVLPAPEVTEPDVVASSSIEPSRPTSSQTSQTPASVTGGQNEVKSETEDDQPSSTEQPPLVDHHPSPAVPARAPVIPEQEDDEDSKPPPVEDKANVTELEMPSFR